MLPKPDLEFAAVILAAGTARRMGQLKQLLPYGASGSLLQHAIRQARDAGFAPVVVVTGAQAERVEQILLSESTVAVRNPQWESGMGSSIVAGVSALNPAVDRVALLAGDQPLITAQHLLNMRREFDKHPEADALAAEYSGTLGIPALFRSTLFGQLRALAPESGAKQLLKNSSVRVLPFPLPEAAADIDTPEDFERLLANQR